jgi:hypothetical protein
MDSGLQPALVVVPDDLTDLADHLRNRLKRRGTINRSFESLPEAFDRIIFRRIRRQMFECHPVMLLHKPFDRSTFVNLGIVENQKHQNVGKALMELVKKLHEPLRRASGGLFPMNWLRVFKIRLAS